VFFLAALGLSLFGQALLVKLFGTHLNTTALIALNLMGIILSGYYCLKPITTLHGYLVRQLTLSAMLVGVYILSSVSAYQKNVTQLYAYLQQTSQNHPLAYVLKPDGLYYFFSVGYGAPSINQTFLTDDSQIAPWKQQHPTGFLVNSYSVKPKNMNNILYYTQVKTAEFITVEK